MNAEMSSLPVGKRTPVIREMWWPYNYSNISQGLLWEGALLKIRLWDKQLPLLSTIMIKLMSTKNIGMAYDVPKEITNRQMKTKRKKKRKRKMRKRGRRRKIELTEN